MIKMGFRLTLVTFLLLGLGMLAAPAAAANTPEISYWVQLAPADASGAPLIQVQVDIPTQPGAPLHLSALQDYAGGRVESLASHYTLTEAHDGTGLALQISGTAGDWTVTAPSDEHVIVAYTVNLSGYQTDAAFAGAITGGAPWPYFPSLSQGCLYLPGYSAFLYPDGLRDAGTARVYLQLPAGWNSVAPMPAADGAFAGSWQDLTGNVFLGGTGDLVLKQASVAGTAVTLALGPGAGPTNLKSLDEAYARLSSMTEQAAKFLNQQGGSGTFLLLFAFGPQGQGGVMPPYEEVASLGASATISVPADSNILSNDATVLIGRAVFSFLENRALTGQPVPAWFRAGTAGYYQLSLPYTAGLITSNDFWDRLNLIYADYQANPLARSLTLDDSAARLPEVDAERLLEEKGTVVVASMDQRIRDITNNRSTLDDLMKRLAGLDGYSPGTLDEAGLQANLESLTAVSWKDFFEQNVTGTAQVKSSSFSNLTALGRAGATPANQPVQSGPTKSWAWVFVGLAAVLIFAIPVLLEPYTVKPRKGSKSDSGS